MSFENSLVPAIAECERVLSEAAGHFGLSCKTEQIVVTVASAGKSRAIGWFCGGSWKNGKPEALHEINLSSEHLKTACMGNLILHELAHAENHSLGVKDCSGKSHNKRFKVMAERLGLTVKDRDKRVGFGYTDLGEAGKAFLEKIAFKRELFSAARLRQVSTAKVGSRLIKCECRSCGYCVRIAQKWIDEGLPTCHCGTEIEVAA